MRPLWLAAASIALVACSTGVASNAKAQRWTCSMHPAYLADRPGECPICGMRLTPVANPVAQPPKPERKPLYYRSPMNPSATSPVPRKDEMGMDYVPVYPGEVEPGGAAGLSTVQIDPERRHLIGLKTAEVKRAPLETSIRTVGRVAFDETRIVKVQPHFEGFIERLDANYSGKFVKKGESLATIYSPDLLATEQEFLLAVKARPSLANLGMPDAAEAARARLRLWGISDGAIDALEKTGKASRALPLNAPISGFVTAKNVVAGAKVGPTDALFDLADLSRVWVLADVYEYELPRLELGQSATVTLSYWPDRKWKGRIGFIYPTVDEKTRTVRVRIEVDNPKTELKPEMFADVVIASAPRRALLVPEDAVIDSGTRKVVFVALGEGRLAPREIMTGDRGKGMVEVKSGLAAGDVVATGASFLLDSESQLRAAIAAQSPTPVDGGQP